MSPAAEMPQGGRVRVLVHLNAQPGDKDTLAALYHSISTALAGTPGLLANEFLDSTRDGRSFAIMSEWEDMASFTEWERSADHLRTTAPLQPFHDLGRDVAFEIFEVAAAYSGAASPEGTEPPLDGLTSVAPGRDGALSPGSDRTEGRWI